MDISIDTAYAAKLLGVRGANAETLDSRLAKQINECAKRVIAASRPMFVTCEFEVSRDETGVALGGVEVVLPGRAIAALLGRSKAAVCFAATIGFAVDLLISTEQKMNMAEAAVLDACASAAIENLCDRLNEQLTESYIKRGLALTRRFSPGYGDLPLSVQRGLLRALEADRRVGITEEGGFMSPMKSVSAIIGIIDASTAGAKETAGFMACAFCEFQNNCNGVCRNEVS